MVHPIGGFNPPYQRAPSLQLHHPVRQHPNLSLRPQPNGRTLADQLDHWADQGKHTRLRARQGVQQSLANASQNSSSPERGSTPHPGQQIPVRDLSRFSRVDSILEAARPGPQCARGGGEVSIL
jgi:hypothetical protein